MSVAFPNELPASLASQPKAAVAASEAKGRVVFLDVVRGLAALIVLLEHTNEVLHHSFLMWSFKWANVGRTGVAAFFLVSGFVIPYSLERANSLRVFWISRFFRLYPLYWASLIIGVSLFAAGILPWPDHRWRVVAANVTMFQEFLGQPHVIGLYWTLTLEMVFYIAFSVLFALGINQKSVLWAWLGLGLMVLMGAMDRNGIQHGMHHKLPVARFVLLEFALIGTVIFRHCSGKVSMGQLGALVGASLVALALAMWLSFRGPGEVSPVDEEWSWVSMFNSYALAFVLFAIVFLFRAKTFPWALRWLGAISYSVYLLHYPTWLLLLKFHFGKPEVVGGAVWVIEVIIATCLVSSFTYLFVEKPGIRLGKHLAHTPRGATVGAHAAP